jgi:hypothetical protein
MPSCMEEVSPLNCKCVMYAGLFWFDRAPVRTYFPFARVHNTEDETVSHAFPMFGGRT